jgi:hypothetical protein
MRAFAGSRLQPWLQRQYLFWLVVKYSDISEICKVSAGFSRLTKKLWMETNFPSLVHDISTGQVAVFRLTHLSWWKQSFVRDKQLAHDKSPCHATVHRHRYISCMHHMSDEGTAKVYQRSYEYLLTRASCRSRSTLRLRDGWSSARVMLIWVLAAHGSDFISWGRWEWKRRMPDDQSPSTVILRESSPTLLS